MPSKTFCRKKMHWLLSAISSGEAIVLNKHPLRFFPVWYSLSRWVNWGNAEYVSYSWTQQNDASRVRNVDLCTLTIVTTWPICPNMRNFEAFLSFYVTINFFFFKYFKRNHCVKKWHVNCKKTYVCITIIVVS